MGRGVEEMSVADPIKAEAFKLKGRLFTLTVLELHTVRIEPLLAELNAVVKKAPKMFVYTPVVLDISPLNGASFDLKGVVDAMRSVDMVPIAVQGASLIQQKAAIKVGLSIITSSSKQGGEMMTDIPEPFKVKDQEAKAPDEQDTQKPKEPEVGNDEQTVAPMQIAKSNAKIVTSPVRSGQQIYAKGCDLIVLAPVSRGSEVLADGNIHVYGPLRGRALAGILGDKSARIFCQQLEAELLSIAGCFKLSEDLPELKDKSTKQVYLDEQESLCIQPL
jgi:septum site-determining protein MinC